MICKGKLYKTINIYNNLYKLIGIEFICDNCAYSLIIKDKHRVDKLKYKSNLHTLKIKHLIT